MEFFDVIHTQRSIRRFKPDPVPDDLLWQLIDAAIKAPSGSNTQPWIWLIVRDGEKRGILGQAVRDNLLPGNRLAELQQEIARRETSSGRLSLKRAIELFQNLEHAPVIVIPCLVGLSSPVADNQTLLAGSSIYGAVQNMMLAARALQIGSVLTTFNSFMEDTIRDQFELPSDAVPVAVIPIGYPDNQTFGPTTRKPAEAVTYWDKWGMTQQRP